MSQFTEVRRQAKALPRYRTQCKLCKGIITWGQETVWLANPMGLSHKACV